MPTGSVISIKNVDHFYGSGALRKQVLFDISTEISPGEIVLLDTLPAASTGKILKHKLWEAAQAAKARAEVSPPMSVRTVA